MKPINTAQLSHVGGEMSAATFGRADLARFTTSSSVLENFIPTMEGELTRRPGTQVITWGATPTLTFSNGRLIPFSSGSFSAAILFRAATAHIFGGSVAEDVVVTTPYTLAQVPYIQVCQVNDVLFLTHQAHPPARLARYGIGTWAYEVLTLEEGPYLDYRSQDAGISLKLGSVVDRITLTSTATDFSGVAVNDYVEYNSTSTRALGKVVTATSSTTVVIEPLQERCFAPAVEVYALGLYTGYGTGGTAPYNLATAANYDPFPADSSSAETDVQVGFTHQNVITNAVVGNFLRFSDISGTYRWMLVDGRTDVPEQSSFGIIANGDIIPVNAHTVPVPYTGTVTQSDRIITATMTSSSDAFTSSDLGRWFRLEYGSFIVDAKVTAVGGARSVSVTLSRNVPVASDGARRMDSTTTVWRRGSFYPGNYPRCVSFFEQRLCLSNTPLEPQTVWLSKVADYYSFAPTTAESKIEDDLSINLTMATDVFQDIRWLTNRSALVAGTSNAEWTVSTGRDSGVLTPKTVTAHRESSYGSADIQAVQSGRSVLFVQEGGLRLRELTYDQSVDANVPIDVSVFAPHILANYGGATELHYLRQPYPAVVLVTASGQLAIMVYEPDQKVYAWSRHILGGTGSPKIVSACATQSQGIDTLWALVLRNSIYTVEKFFPTYRPLSADDVSTIHYFMDSATQFATGSASVTLTGHERFRDTTVAVLLDDQLYPEITTVGLVLTLPRAPATRLWVGLVSTAKVVSFPVTFESTTGATQGRTRVVTGLTLRVKNTLDFHYGVDGIALEEYKPRTTSDPVNQTPYLRTGDIRLQLPRKFDTLVKWTIESRRPYPTTIQSVSIDLTQTN